MNNPMKYYLLMLFFYCLSTISYSQDIQLCAIINKNTPNQNISLEVLTSIVKGEKTHWNNGIPIILAIMSPYTKEGTATANAILNCSAKRMNKYYLSMTFQDKMTPPVFFEFEDELIDYVNNNENAIGIINYNSANNVSKMFIDDNNDFKINYYLK